LIKKR